MSTARSATPEIKLPNRSTAKEVSPRYQQEVSQIRQQLHTIQEDLQREDQADKAQDQLEDDVTTLYHELQRAAAKLESEKAQRRKIENELENLRNHRLKETADIVAELERKRGELNTLRDERSMMKEWLDRGVQECKRVADEVIRLKGELDTSEKNCGQLTREKHRLAATIQQLSDELAGLQSTLERVHHEKSVAELRAEESTAMLSRAEEQRKSVMVECDRLSSEVIRLSQRVKGLEDAEVSLQSMCSCIDQLSLEISQLDHSIATGNLDAPFAQSTINEAQFNVGETKTLSALVIDAKRLLQHLQDTVGRVRATTRRFVGEKQKGYAEMCRAQETEITSIHREREALIRQHEDERTALKLRIQGLEREIVHVAEGVERDMQVEANERLAALERLTQSNKDLFLTNERLREDNDKLKAKVKHMKIDWTKVDESRRRFQQLQIEVQMMKEHCEKLGMENKNLKLMAESLSSAKRRGGAPGSVSANSPLAEEYITPDSLQLMHRQAFEEWRQHAGQAYE